MQPAEQDVKIRLLQAAKKLLSRQQQLIDDMNSFILNGLMVKTES